MEGMDEKIEIKAPSAYDEPASDIEIRICRKQNGNFYTLLHGQVWLAKTKQEAATVLRDLMRAALDKLEGVAASTSTVIDPGPPVHAVSAMYGSTVFAPDS